MNAHMHIKVEISACLKRIERLVSELTYEEKVVLTQSPTCYQAMRRIASAMGTTEDRIRMRSNEQRIVINRQICQHVLYGTGMFSYPEIARATGITDHTTVMHSCKKIQRMREANQEFDKKVRDLCSVILDRPNSQKDVA